jgi:hypothetical protein
VLLHVPTKTQLTNKGLSAAWTQEGLDVPMVTHVVVVADLGDKVLSTLVATGQQKRKSLMMTILVL